MAETPPTRSHSTRAYVIITISLLALLLSFLHGPTAPLPDLLRRHRSTGKLLADIFVSDTGNTDSDTVLLLHGLGSSSFSFRHVIPILANAGLRAVAIDLPGSGFSSKPSDTGILARIRDHGIFSAFEILVETGEITSPDEFSKSAVSGLIIDKVFDEMSLTAPVNLVLHDSALAVSAKWVVDNAHRVSSMTLVDTPVSEPPAFPFQFLQVPIVGSLLLKSKFLFSRLLRLCCSRSVGEADAEAYRFLLGADGGKQGVVEMGKELNHSFDLGEWAKSEGLKGMAIQVLWSTMWTDRWIEEGRRVAAAVPQAKFAWHSGGRWPQEDSAEEIAGMIVQFVSSLPNSNGQVKEDHTRDHTRTEIESAEDNYNLVHGHGYGDENVADYVGTYGRGQ